MERTKYKYSIISYIPNSVRNEKINIGAILIDSNDAIIKYSVLPENTRKFNGIFENSDEHTLFKETLSLLSFELKNITENPSLLTSDLKSFNDITNKLDNISLSKFFYGASFNLNNVFKYIISTYIGNKFYVTIHQENANVKLDNFIVDKKLSSRVLKKPKLNFALNYTTDYAFLDNENPSLLNTVPNSEQGIHDWYSKMNLFSSRFQSDNGKIIILHDNLNNSSRLLSQLADIRNDLKKNDSRFKFYNIDNSEFNDFEQYFTKITKDSTTEDVRNILKEKNLIA